MKWPLLVTFCFFSSLGAAQTYDGDAERTGQAELSRSGKLVNLTVEPGEKQIRLQIVSKDIAIIKADDQAVEAYYGEGEQRQRVKLIRLKTPGKPDVYAFDRPNAPIEHLEINVRQGKDNETFKIPRVR